MVIRVVGPRDYTPLGELVVNTTSRSTESWSKGLSPFFLGPIPLYEGAPRSTALVMENAWQFSKVYPRHVGADGNPTQDYFEWARAGWADPRAVRYPMGKGAKPAFSWWGGEALPYVQARLRVYVPLYGRAVSKTPAFARLLTLCRENGGVTLWDFDGYDHLKLGLTVKEVLHSERKCGHAFVLAALLEKMLSV